MSRNHLPLWMILCLPNYACIKLYCFNQKLKRIHNRTVSRVASASIRFVASEDSDIPISAKKGFESAKSASDIVLLYVITFVFLAWIVDVYSGHTVSKTVYGLFLSGGASILLAGADLRESREQLSGGDSTHRNKINRAVLRGLAFVLFGLGFFLQVLVIALPEVVGAAQFDYTVVMGVVDIVFPLLFVVCFLIFFGVYDILSVVVLYTFIGVVFATMISFANILSGSVVAAWTFVGLMLTILLAVIIYFLYYSYKFLRSVLNIGDPLPFEK